MLEKMSCSPTCQYIPTNPSQYIFTCKVCKSIHKCTEVDCEAVHGIYNGDGLFTCSLSGRCFRPMMCDANAGFHLRASVNTIVHDPPQRMSLRVKNQTFDRDLVYVVASQMIDHHDDGTTSAKLTHLHDKSLDAWEAFVQGNISCVIHKRDRLLFAVALVYSLERGLYVGAGHALVVPDPWFHNNIKLHHQKKTKRTRESMAAAVTEPGWVKHARESSITATEYGVLTVKLGDIRTAIRLVQTRMRSIPDATDIPTIDTTTIANVCKPSRKSKRTRTLR